MISARTRFVVAASLVIMTTTMAHADEPAEPKADNRARAQQLFDSALSDAEAGRFSAACPKFLASQEADPKTSTLLNLASCYEKNGQTASAWGAFREAETLARKASRADWETSARTRAEALEPQLVRLSVIVSEANRAPGLVITRDGARLAQGEWGVAIPVDPGEHIIAASADGRRGWEIRVPVRPAEPNVSVEVPKLEALPQEAPLVPLDQHPLIAQPPTKPGWSTWKTVGAITAGAGAVSMVVGGLVGLAAKGDYNSARAQCRDGPRGCPSSAIDEADAAYGLATGATVIFVVGAAMLAGGATLFILDPGSSGSGSSTATGRSMPRRSVAFTPLAMTW